MVGDNDNAVSGALTPIDRVLRELAARESGVGFIYGALNVLAERHGLNDVAIVLESSAISTRVFRLDGNGVDSKTVAALGTSPGVYCLPDIVPRSELELIYSACQEAYPHGLFRDVPIDDNPDLRDDERTNLLAELTVETLRNDVPGNSETSSGGPKRRSIHEGPSARAHPTRQVISRFLLVIDITTLVLTLTGIHGPLRLVCGLILAIVIPGWCILAPLKLDNAPLELGLVITVSLALLMVVAQILMTLRLWHLVGLQIITCAACLPFLLIQARLTTPRLLTFSPKLNHRTKTPSAS